MDAAIDAGAAAIAAVVDAGVAAAGSIAPPSAPAAAPGIPEWVKIALGAGAGAGAIVTAVVTIFGWRFQARLERLKAQLAELTRLSTTGVEKRAEVAAQALVAVLRMLDALEGATSLGSFTPSGAEDRSADRAARDRLMVLEVEARSASIEPYDEEFRRAWHMAEVFLPEDVRELLRTINNLRGEILAGHRMHAMALTQSPQHAVEFYKQGYGMEPQRKLAEVRQKAKALLRPIAQLGAPHS
jgi:hypothetical protein